MPKRISPEKVAGIVAISYLALIPAGGLLAWLKIRQLDRDLTAVWDQMGMDTTTAPSTWNLSRLRDLIASPGRVTIVHDNAEVGG